MNKIEKNKFSAIFKIGRTDLKVPITEDNFYYKDGNGKHLHLNALAWESPSKWVDDNGKEYRGFVPGDKFYDEIVAEFKSYPDKYRAGNTVRKIIPNSSYDAIVSWIPEIKMVSWYFINSCEYCID